MVEKLKEIIIYNYSTLVMEKISKLSKNGCDDVLLNYICYNYDEIEYELNPDEYEESKKHNYNFCVAYNKEMLSDSQKSILVCTKRGLYEYYPVYVTSYNHLMKPLRGKCFYKRSDNFKAILNQFFYGGKQLVPDDVMKAIRNEIHNRDNYDEIEYELNPDEYEESKKHNYNFCVAYNKEMLSDSQKSILVCTKRGLYEYYPVYVTSYNHLMKPLRGKCFYKRSDNFKAILNQFFYGGKQLVPDDVMKAIRNEIHNRDNILYNYEIPLTIPILECILKRNKMMKYKNSIYYVFLKLNNQPFHTSQQKNTI